MKMLSLEDYRKTYRKTFLAALRSGEYQQIHGWGKGKTRCALGVALEEFDIKEHVYSNLLLTLGLSEGDVNQIAVLNDIWSWGFEQIADYLEAKWAMAPERLGELVPA